MTYEYLHPTGGLTAVRSVSTGQAEATYGLDDSGRVTTLTRGGVTKALHWDAWERLVGAEVPSAGVVARYEYDGRGLRRRAAVEVTQTPPTGPPAVTTTTTRTWSWGGEDGEEEVAEGSAAVVRVGGFVVAQGGARYGHDGLGSAVRETTAPGVTSEGAYGAWGSRDAPGFTTDVGFTGHRAEEVLGLTYAQQRWYDSQTVRFLSRDSVGAAPRLVHPTAVSGTAWAMLR